MQLLLLARPRTIFTAQLLRNLAELFDEIDDVVVFK